MANLKDIKISCYGCKHFFITHKPQRPYGCSIFGFESKKLPAMVVIETTGTQCAYRKKRESIQSGREQKQRNV